MTSTRQVLVSNAPRPPSPAHAYHKMEILKPKSRMYVPFGIYKCNRHARVIRAAILLRRIAL